MRRQYLALYLVTGDAGVSDELIDEAIGNATFNV
jgi:hypothetical protein